MSNIEVYRPKPLAFEDFTKLDTVCAQRMTITERVERVPYWDKDEYGERIERMQDGKREIVVLQRDEISDALRESLLRPAPIRHIAVHLARLAAHKPYTRGDAGFQIIVGDIARDLDGCSEYALMKVCEAARLDTSSKFFPDTATLVQQVRALSHALANPLRERKFRQVPIERAPVEKKTAKQKRRIARLCRLASKPEANWSKWEKRFFAYFKVNKG